MGLSDRRRDPGESGQLFTGWEAVRGYSVGACGDGFWAGGTREAKCALKPCYTDSVKSRNITITLPAELVRTARIFAAERDTTLNALLREMLQDRLGKEGRMRAAVERMLDVAEHGPWSHVDPKSCRREELYERP